MLVDIGQFVLITRSSLVDVLTEDFITTAKAKGNPRRRVVWSHGVRNGMLPVVTATALYVGLVVGGAIQVETVFSWPGMGELTYEAVLRRDYPVLEACFLLFAFTVIVANFLTDLPTAARPTGAGGLMALILDQTERTGAVAVTRADVRARSGAIAPGRSD